MSAQFILQYKNSELEYEYTLTSGKYGTLYTLFPAVLPLNMEDYKTGRNKTGHTSNLQSSRSSMHAGRAPWGRKDWIKIEGQMKNTLPWALLIVTWGGPWFRNAN